MLAEEKEILKEENNKEGPLDTHRPTCMYVCMHVCMYTVISKFHNTLVRYIFSAFLWKRKLRFIKISKLPKNHTGNQ